VYWQVVLLGIAAAVAVVILGVAVFMPPAPPSPPQLYVKVVPSGGSYLLYVNDSKALREVWYSRNGGPLLRADGPIRARCGDRVEVTVVYEDGSRHSAAAVVRCSTPFRAPSSFQVFNATFFTQQAEYDVVRDASGDSVEYVVTVYKCSGADAWFAVAGRSRHGTHGGLPYFARLTIKRNYAGGTVTIREYRGVYPLTFGPLTALYDPHTLTPYDVEYVLQISTLHPPTFATASGYLAGGPITFKITYKVNATSTSTYFWWYANGTFIGMCSISVGQTTHRTKEEVEAGVAAQYHYYYRFENDNTVYRALVVFYEPKNGTFALEAWHTAVLPTDYDYDSTKNICDIKVDTRLGVICTTFPVAVLAGIDYRRGSDYLHDAEEVFWALISKNYTPKLRTPQGSVTWRLWNWYKNLPYDEQTKVVKALFYAGETGLEPVRVGSKTYYVDKVFNSTYTVSIARPNVATFRARSVAVPAVVSAVVQGGAPYLLPDWVALRLGQYSLKISDLSKGINSTQISNFLDYWRQWTALANQSLAGANTPLYYFEPVGAYYVDWP